MAGSRYFRAYFGILFLSVGFYTCSDLMDGSADVSSELKIKLRWIAGSFDHNEAQVKTGLAWAFSYLGADLPKHSLDSAVVTSTGINTFELDLEKLGFRRDADESLVAIIAKLKASEEYLQHGAIDIGRFVVVTLNSSWHYYSIAGVPETLDDLKSLYVFGGKAIRVVNSSVSKVNRLIAISEANEASEIAFISSEGQGSFENNDFIAKEFETVELMRNGQFRFGIYDQNGFLKSAGSPGLTIAGKPAKCMWCHEIYIQPLYLENTLLDGVDYLSMQEFNQLVSDYMKMVDEYRQTLTGDLDFTGLQDHTLMEQLYIDFMEPSPKRLAAEWGMTLESVLAITSEAETHSHSEFIELKDVFHRKDIDHLSPYHVVPIPSSAREFNTEEPNFLGSE